MELTDLINTSWGDVCLDKHELDGVNSTLKLCGTGPMQDGWAEVKTTAASGMGDSSSTLIELTLENTGTYHVRFDETENLIQIKIKAGGNFEYETLRNMFGFVEFALKELEKANTERMKEEQHD